MLARDAAVGVVGVLVATGPSWSPSLLMLFWLLLSSPPPPPHRRGGCKASFVGVLLVQLCFQLIECKTAALIDLHVWLATSEARFLHNACARIGKEHSPEPWVLEQWHFATLEDRILASTECAVDLDGLRAVVCQRRQGSAYEHRPAKQGEGRVF